jgi:Mg-chelatase subunit ChlD
MGGVEAAYKETLRRVSLWGPTNFAEFINRVAQIARDAKVTQERQQYFVLLILTDGIITDMDQTKSVSGCTVLRIA